MTGRGALALLALLGATARGAERFDHRGSVGLLIAPGPSVDTQLGTALSVRALTTVGGTWAVGTSDTELLLLVSPGFFQRAFWLDVSGGVRMDYGYDRWKTFLDLTVSVVTLPFLAVGPRLGGGVQYEVTPQVGAFAGAAVQFGFGSTIHLGAELFVGVQLRSYLLEG